MVKTSYRSILARSALISLLLAAPAMAQSWIGSPPETQVYISVVNVANGKGVFVPAVWVEDAYGRRTQILMGQEGLTRAILYNQSALIAWVLERYGQVNNPKVFFDDRSGDKDTQNPTPDPTPKTPTEPENDPLDDCWIDTGANIQTTDDLPIILAQSLPCKVFNPCDVSYTETPRQPMILRVELPCFPFDLDIGPAIQG
jgi:hypothetical protein